MTDIRTRLAQVDRLEPPDDLWDASSHRMPRHDLERATGVQTGWRKAGVIAVAFAVFGSAVLFAWTVLDVEPEPPKPPAPATDPFLDLPVGWTELPEPPEIRCCSVDAWTGSELLIWGGHVGFSDESLDTGWRYDAEAGEWRQMPAAPLGARSQAAGVWTGEELLVWGGSDFRTDYPYETYDDGAAFDPETDRWRMLPPAPIDGRPPMAVWTGTEMIVWGSTNRDQRRIDGAAYDPGADTWRPIANAPVELTDATASWTGEEMIVFGAALHGGNQAESPTAIGAAYDPVTDTWRQIADSELDTNANTSVWAGEQLLAFDYNLDAAAYDPVEDRWTAMGTVPTDECEDVPSSVVAGTAYGRLCGDLIRFDTGRDSWTRIDEPAKEFFPAELHGAGSTLLVAAVMDPFGEGKDIRFFAYRDDAGDARSSASQHAAEPSVTARIPFPYEDAHGGGIAFGAGSVWVGMASGDSNAVGSVLRIDPVTNRVAAEIPTSGPTFRHRIAATNDAVWVGSTTENVVERIDPATNTVVARVEIEGGISAVTTDDAAVWVVAIDDRSDAGEQNTGRLIRIDPATNEIVAEVPLGRAATGYEDGVLVAAGSVWVVGSRLVDEDHEDGGNLVRVDAANNEKTASIPVDGFRMVASEDGHSIWVRSPRDGLFDDSGEVWVWRSVDTASNGVSEPFRFPSDLDAGLSAISDRTLWAVSYDENDWPRIIGFDAGSLEVVTKSDPVRSLYTDAEFDTATGTAWLTTLDAIIRVDTRAPTG